MSSERFDFAMYQLTEKGNPEPLRKELARLEATSIGKQITAAHDALSEHAVEAHPTAP
jgi:hypothetical protein